MTECKTGFSAADRLSLHDVKNNSALQNGLYQGAKRSVSWCDIEHIRG